MSQAGILDVENSNPQIPTEFVTDDGTAIPIANTLEILGDVVPAGSLPPAVEAVYTSGSGNTVTVNVQTSSAQAASDILNVGLSSFDSDDFTVDANGFVQLVGGSVMTNLGVDTATVPGTDPVVPDGAGTINLTGAQVAAGTTANVIRTNSLAANTAIIEIQRSTAVAGSSLASNGVCHFDSSEFTVDGNGFVGLIGGALAVDSFAMQTGTSPVVPTVAGLVTFNGAVVAAGTNPVRTDGTGANTMALEVQISQALAATDATKIGLSNFDSAAFDVDANGFVQLNGGGIAATSFDVQANTAPGTDPVVPTAAGVVTVNGAAVANHSVVLETRSRAANAYNLEVQYATSAAATDATKSGVAHFDSADFSVDANGFVQFAGGGATQTLTPDLDFDGSAATPVAPQAGNINFISYNPSFATVTNVLNSTGAATGNMQVEHRAWLTGLVVDPSATLGTRGTFQTIAAALTAAVSGQTIFIRTGSYTENLTLKAGVNLSSFTGDGMTPNVTIIGTCTATFAGTCTISGIRLQTNSSFLLTVSGSSATIVNLVNCYLNCTNNTGISYTSSSASSLIRAFYCLGDLTTTGIAYAAASGAGRIRIEYCRLDNTGGATTNTTVSAGQFTVEWSTFKNAITTSSTGQMGFLGVTMELADFTAITHGGSPEGSARFCRLSTGTASAISVGTGASFVAFNCQLTSSNAAVITGLGEIKYATNAFGGTSSGVNTTTQTVNYEGPSKTIGSTNSGAANTLLVTNDSNTATSSANIVASVAGATAADPTHQSIIAGVTTWTWGADNSVTSPTADPFVISQGTALGTNNVMSVATSGEINYPLQPAFEAYLTNTVTNATGDGTNYTIIFDTEVFDQGGDFNLAASTFTAPVTGRYQINLGVKAQGGSGITAGFVNIVTTSVTFRNSIMLLITAGQCQSTYSQLLNFTAADTLTVSIQITDSGGKVVDISGTTSSQPQTYLSGYLVA